MFQAGKEAETLLFFDMYCEKKSKKVLLGQKGYPFGFVLVLWNWELVQKS